MIKRQQAGALAFLNEWLAGKAPVACLQGYAGTGKTWLSGYWLAQIMDANPEWHIQVLAPTNKALDVLREKCSGLNQTLVSFATCDSFLGRSIKRNDDGDIVKSQGKGHDAEELTLCDEAGMVKAEYDSALRRRAKRLLYIGDPAQLPPINEEISTSFLNCPTFLMTEVVRFDGNIIRVATMLRERIESKAIFLLQDVRNVCEIDDKSVAFTSKDNLHDWALNAIGKGMDQRIVAYTNADVTMHNRIMHRVLYPNDALYGVGERIIVNETYDLNDDEMLYNGEMLTVISCDRAEDVAGVVIYDVKFQRDSDKANILEINGIGQPQRVYELKVPFDEQHMIEVRNGLTAEIWKLRKEQGAFQEVQKLVQLRKPLNKLAPLRHAYACTCHKSQGSTYDVTFVDWPSVFRSQDRARMMYVAATRPSKFLVLAYK
jgi:AAA domain/UvrD-like helicase C-terminal domain